MGFHSSHCRLLKNNTNLTTQIHQRLGRNLFCVVHIPCLSQELCAGGGYFRGMLNLIEMGDFNIMLAIRKDFPALDFAYAADGFSLRTQQTGYEQRKFNNADTSMITPEFCFALSIYHVFRKSSAPAGALFSRNVKPYRDGRFQHNVCHS